MSADIQIPDHPRTLAEKLWDDHVVVRGDGGQPDLIYIDLHLIHEVTSPQAFDGLRTENRPLRRVDLTIGTEDHNTRSTSRSPTSRAARRSRHCAATRRSMVCGCTRSAIPSRASCT